MSNEQQTSLEWLINQLQRSKDWYRIINEINFKCQKNKEFIIFILFFILFLYVSIFFIM